MSEAEMRNALGQCFDHIDADKSGFLDKNEILTVLKQFCESDHCKCSKKPADLEADVNDFVKVVDSNADGKINKKEFLDFFVKLLKESMPSEGEIKKALIECFDSIDKDKSGTLDIKEIMLVLRAFNEKQKDSMKKTQAQLDEDCKLFIKDVDKNNDNKISKTEFVDYFLKLLI